MSPQSPASSLQPPLRAAQPLASSLQSLHQRALSLRAFLLPVLLLCVRPAAAVNFTVNTTVDDVDANPTDGRCETPAGGGDCSLRAAIQQANAAAGADIIELPAGVYSLVTPGTDENDAATGDLDVREDLQINGAGADTTIINGGRLDRVFELDPLRVGGVEVEIAGVTVQDGSLRDLGAGILSNGTLTLRDAAVSGNTANASDGGGIYTRGPTTLTNVLVSGNSASGDGGGIRSGGTLTVTNSTVSGNMAVNSAGGIDSRATLALSHSTIASNTSATAGGIISRVAANRATVRGTIITDNTGGDCGSAMTSNGYNLGAAACGFTAATDIDDVDALLCPLANYGGPTFTHALPQGSGALEAGPPDCPPADQRSLPRPRDGDGDGEAVCDIGAFEAQSEAMGCEPIIPTVTPTRPPPTVTATPTPTRPVTSVCAGDCGDDGSVSVDELLRGIGIALGTATVDACEAADIDGDGQVSIDELVAVVQRALGGCVP